MTTLQDYTYSLLQFGDYKIQLSCHLQNVYLTYIFVLSCTFCKPPIRRRSKCRPETLSFYYYSIIYSFKLQKQNLFVHINFR